MLTKIEADDRYDLLVQSMSEYDVYRLMNHMSTNFPILRRVYRQIPDHVHPWNVDDDQLPSNTIMLRIGLTKDQWRMTRDSLRGNLFMERGHEPTLRELVCVLPDEILSESYGEETDHDSQNR